MSKYSAPFGHVRQGQPRRGIDAYIGQVEFETLPVPVNRMLLTVIFGAVRNAFERGYPGEVAVDLRRQLVIMCRAYLDAS